MIFLDLNNRMDHLANHFRGGGFSRLVLCGCWGEDSLPGLEVVEADDRADSAVEFVEGVQRCRCLGSLQIYHLTLQFVHLLLESQRGLIRHVAREEPHESAVQGTMVAKLVLEIGVHAVLSLQRDPSKT